MNIMGLLARFVVQPNVGEPSREIALKLLLAGPVSV